MNDKEIKIICATQRGIAQARQALLADPEAWIPAIGDMLETRMDRPLSSELCGYYAAMVQHWTDLGRPDVFT